MNLETFSVINDFLIAHGVRLTHYSPQWRVYRFGDIYDPMTSSEMVEFDDYASALHWALHLAAKDPNRFSVKARELTVYFLVFYMWIVAIIGAIALS